MAGLHRDRAARRERAVFGALAAVLLSSCAAGRAPVPPLLAALDAPAVLAPAGGYDFFAKPPARDPWTRRIRFWQVRQQAAYRAGLLRPMPRLPAVAPVVSAGASTEGGVAPNGPLSARYDEFMSSRRREIARQVIAWVQAEAERRFLDDGPVDHWPTLPEVMAADGDDCDGLELLTYHALRQLGFSEDRVFRAVLHGTRFDQHHMVTLWFEDPNDPWLLDPTETIITPMRRLSEIEGWVPLKVFSETREYSVSAR